MEKNNELFKRKLGGEIMECVERELDMIMDVTKVFQNGKSYIQTIEFCPERQSRK
jgi:hypothetical protein